MDKEKQKLLEKLIKTKEDIIRLKKQKNEDYIEIKPQNKNNTK